MTDRLPLLEGRAPRIALLVYNQVTTDNRVLKTAASLRDAGAEVLVVGTERAGYPAGDDIVGSALPLHRVAAFDLVRLLPWLAAAVRRVRGSRPARPPERAAVPADADRPPPAGLRTERPTAPHPSVRSIAADLWMRLYQVVRLVWFWAGAVRHLRGWRPDVVHANDGNTLVPAMVLRRTARTPFVYDAHELWTRRNVLADRWLAPYVEALIERLAVRRAAGVITVSASIATWIRRHYSLPRTPTLVRNIPHRTAPVPDPSQGRLRELTGLAPDQQVIAYCGGLTTGRGLEETVAALADLPPRVHLVMLGYGETAYVDALRARATQLGVAERVHLLAPVPGPQVPITLADADASVVYVRPICLSYRYALPNKLFESIHAGLPIVAADLPDIAAVVRGTGVGRLFDADEPGELAAAVRGVLADPAPFREASIRAAEELDWRHEAAALVRVHAAAVAGFPA